MAYGSSQARGLTGAAAASLHHSHSNARIWAMSVIYTAAQSNARSLNHWIRPGIEPLSSWTLVGLLTPEPPQELHFKQSLNSGQSVNRKRNNILREWNKCESAVQVSRKKCTVPLIQYLISKFLTYMQFFVVVNTINIKHSNRMPWTWMMVMSFGETKAFKNV